MSDQTSIKCPKCGTSIDVNDILKHQLEDNIRLEYQEKAAKQENEIAVKNEQFEKDKAAFEAKKKQENELFLEKLEKEKKAAEIVITEKVKIKLVEENKELFLSMEKELTEKSEKLSDFNKMVAENAKLQREKLEMKEAIEAENQIKLNETLTLETAT